MSNKRGTIRLDHLYKMISYIYGEQNAQRSAEATFSHFVEVCGMLATHDRQKRREDVSIESALCKALAWYFPLMAKFKVTSIEELIFRKFPLVCPYCRLAPHNDEVCKAVRGTRTTVDHESLRKSYSSNYEKRPASLDEWQSMFRVVYPRSTQDSAGRSTLGLMEEIGELAEAMRVFDRHPKYFAGEAADVFSYLMGFANEHALRMQRDQEKIFSFEEEFLRRYPGMCVQCGYSICVCPYIPAATVGRMAKELDLRPQDDLFLLSGETLQAEAKEIAGVVLEHLGGYEAVASGLPLDRGETNKALIMFCLKLADKIGTDNEDLAQRLRSTAIKIGSETAVAGTRRQPELINSLVASVRELIDGLGGTIAPLLQDSDKSLPATLGRILTKDKDAPRF